MRKSGNFLRGGEMLRLLDANLNRAREAARVVEDIARFCLDDKRAARQLREIRAGLGSLAARAGIGGASLLAARDTGRDVGRKSPHRPPRKGAGEIESIAAANFARLQEALRSLEECVRLLDRGGSARLQSYRFKSYELHKAVSLALGRRRILENTRLYALLTTRLAPKGLERTARALIRGGADVIQLREKTLPDRQMLRAAKKIVSICRRARAVSIINDRPDVVLAAGADGVHLGPEDMPVAEARRILGGAKIIGATARSLAAARRAVREGADYVSIGPVYRSSVAPAKEPISPATLRAVARLIDAPVYAIGGITAENLPRVLKSGVRRVAACSALIAAKNPAAAAARFKKILSTVRGRGAVGRVGRVGPV